MDNLNPELTPADKARAQLRAMLRGQPDPFVPVHFAIPGEGQSRPQQLTAEQAPRKPLGFAIPDDPSPMLAEQRRQEPAAQDASPSRLPFAVPTEGTR